MAVRARGWGVKERAWRFFPRALAPVILLPATLLAAASPSLGQAARKPMPAPVAPASVPVDTSAWLYKGSDLKQDPEWKFGALPNGLRYAVRKNGVPPGQVVDPGEDRRGFA